MECNKDEAFRAKEIAEKKLLERDFTGARKFALKAQSLFPKLEGLSQFLETIDVYVAYEKKINEEVDYYKILGVDPFADEELLKKKYRRMALSLHPDKNKSAGADGAFKIMSEAWRVLSNKDERTAYDSKMNIRASNQNSNFSSLSARYTTPAADPQHVSTQPCSSASHHTRNTTSGTHFQHTPCHQRTPSAATDVGSPYTPPQPPLNPTPGTSSTNVPDYQRTPATAVQFESIHVPPRPRPTGNQCSSSRNPRLVRWRRKTPAFRSQNIPSRNQPTSSTCQSRPERFWASCNRCRIWYEFPRIYVNQNLLCSRCQLPFLATEVLLQV